VILIREAEFERHSANLNYRVAERFAVCVR